MPGFPNLFCLYGPNTNIVHGGSIIYQIECQIHYVMQCLALMLEKSLDALDVRADANASYNEDVQARSANLAWGHPNVQSWYKNSDGQVINNSPFSLQEFWEVTHDITPEDFELLHAGVTRPLISAEGMTQQALAELTQRRQGRCDESGCSESVKPSLARAFLGTARSSCRHRPKAWPNQWSRERRP